MVQTSLSALGSETASGGGLRVLFAVFQTGSGANGGVESITQVIEHLTEVRRVVVTQKETPVCGRWRAVAEVLFLALPYELGQKISGGRLRRIMVKAVCMLRNNVRTLSLLRGRQINVLHANDTDALLHTGFAARLVGVPVVLNVRDIHEPHRAYGSKWRVARALSHRLIALSHEMVEQLAARLPSVGARGNSDLGAIYSIVDLDRMRPLETSEREERRRALGIAPDERAVGYVANVFDKKNQLEVLREVVPALMRDQPRVRFHFLGDFEPEKSAYARTCAEVAAQVDPERRHIVFHGYTPDVARWYPAFDVVALASRREGLARCMIESLASGTPVVSFAVCSAREILEQYACGRVVPHGDYPGFAAALNEVLDDADSAGAMGRNGASMARRLFRAEAATSAYRDVYRSLAKR